MLTIVDYAVVDGDAPPVFSAARSAGAVAVAIRGAWGYKGQAAADKTLARDAAPARAAGLQVLSYLFLDYETNPELQADVMAAAYARAEGDLPVALDLEIDTPPLGTTPASRLAIAERCLTRLQQHFGARGVQIYTSLEQWGDHFGDLPSSALGACPLWLKIPYAWKARNAPHLPGPMTELPRPWRDASSPGAWSVQFQGDALGFPGFSSTVDLSYFVPFRAGAPDARAPYVASAIACAGPEVLPTALPAWQAAHGLAADSIGGPATFAALTR
jgi:hypothetical protein